MEAQARASIDIQGTVLRYAEVERYGARYRLLRLGSCDFDFDAAYELLHAAEPTHLEVIADALGDVFEGATATQLNISLHPPGGYSFFAPLPAELGEEACLAHLEQEASLLANCSEEEALFLEVDPLYAEALEEGQTVNWFHVLALETPIYARFERILQRLPQLQYRLSVSTHGAAAVIGHLAEEGAGRLRLGIGRYDTHVEYVLCRGASWLYSHYAPVEAAADCAYFAVALLQRLGLAPEEVSRLFVYGKEMSTEEQSLLQSSLRRAPERLDPIRVVDLDPGSLSDDFDAAAYVPCIGVTL